MLQLNNASGLQTASLDTSGVSVGENVVGVGNAGGTGGTPSAAGGTVTAVNQSITASDEGDGTSEQLSGLIETNANIQPGDSGGALVNTSGQVVGIDTAASAGFSFQSQRSVRAMRSRSLRRRPSPRRSWTVARRRPSTSARRHSSGSRSARQVRRARRSVGSAVGSAASSETPETPGTPGTPATATRGRASAVPLMVGVVTNGPAQEAGLAEGDVITSLGGHSVTSANDLTAGNEQLPPGRQGGGRLDRFVGQLAHRHGAAELRSPAVEADTPDAGTPAGYRDVPH